METDKITFVVDKELKTKLKVIAAKKNLTITEIVTSLVQDYVDKNE